MILQVDGINAHVERMGSGQQILLLHGWGPQSITLEKHLQPVAQPLKNRYEITLLEFPGHGRSGQPGAAWGVKEYAEWTLSLMDQQALRQPVIMGHSFGGRVALWLAAHYPDRVKALVLTGCAGLQPKKTLKSRVRSRLFQFGRGSLKVLGLIPALKAREKRWLASLRNEFASADYLATPEALRGSFSRIVRQDLHPLLPQIPQKTLLVWGEKDTATPLWMGQAMQREMPDARLLVYRDDDHFAYRNQLSRFVTAVEAFMEGVEQE